MDKSGIIDSIKLLTKDLIDIAAKHSVGQGVQADSLDSFESAFRFVQEHLLGAAGLTDAEKRDIARVLKDVKKVEDSYT